MSRPYFSVGEEVMLVSKTYPHLNGECRVLDISDLKEQVKRSRMDGINLELDIHHKPTDLRYELTIPSPNAQYNSERRLRNGGWDQSALRKKPEAGEDFRSLMYQLNNERVEEC